MSENKAPLWLIPLFLILAGVLIGLSSIQTHSQNSESPTDTFVSTQYVRDPMTDPIMTKLNMEYRCNNCHQHFKTHDRGRGGEDNQLVGDHKNIILNHGENNRCFNCHHKENKEAFSTHSGEEIPYDKSEQLCKKCHGPKYRDWQNGVHGRPTGYWDAQKGESIKGKCTQCHDPHSPKFKPIKPLPAPKTKTKEAH